MPKQAIKTIKISASFLLALIFSLTFLSNNPALAQKEKPWSCKLNISWLQGDYYYFIALAVKTSFKGQGVLECHKNQAVRAREIILRYTEKSKGPVLVPDKNMRMKIKARFKTTNIKDLFGSHPVLRTAPFKDPKATNIPVLCQGWTGFEGRQAILRDQGNDDKTSACIALRPQSNTFSAQYIQEFKKGWVSLCRRGHQDRCRERP